MRGRIEGGSFSYDVENKNSSVISGGTFHGPVINHESTLAGGTYEDRVTNEKGGIIQDGDFQGRVFNGGNSVNDAEGTIDGGTFRKEVENRSKAKVKDGEFLGTVKNAGTIEDGTFHGDVNNNSGGTIENGLFNRNVTNGGTIKTGKFSDTGSVTNKGTIESGLFKGDVSNEGTIQDGRFDSNVINESSGTINGGTFDGQVTNNGGTMHEGDMLGEWRDHMPPAPAPAPAPGGNAAGQTAQAASHSDGAQRTEPALDPATAAFYRQYEAVYRQLENGLKNTPQNGMLILDAGTVTCLPRHAYLRLASRNDAAVVIRFAYKGKKYQMQIPAGTDMEAFMGAAQYHGFFYVGSLYGIAEI